jgi:hypothetical protein
MAATKKSTAKRSSSPLRRKRAKTAKSPYTGRWRREWLEYTGVDGGTQDGVAACVGAAITDQRLQWLLDDACIDYLKSNEITMSVAEFQARSDKDEYSPIDDLLNHPDHLFPGAVMGEADKFTADQNETFLAAFREFGWTLHDWEWQERMEEGWPGVREQLENFQPEVVKEMISHFIGLGLEAHTGRKAWEAYEEARSRKLLRP